MRKLIEKINNKNSLLTSFKAVDFMLKAAYCDSSLKLIALIELIELLKLI